MQVLLTSLLRKELEEREWRVEEDGTDGEEWELEQEE